MNKTSPVNTPHRPYLDPLSFLSSGVDEAMLYRWEIGLLCTAGGRALGERFAKRLRHDLWKDCPQSLAVEVLSAQDGPSGGMDRYDLLLVLDDAACRDDALGNLQRAVKARGLAILLSDDSFPPPSVPLPGLRLLVDFARIEVSVWMLMQTVFLPLVGQGLVGLDWQDFVTQLGRAGSIAKLSHVSGESAAELLAQQQCLSTAEAGSGAVLGEHLTLAGGHQLSMLQVREIVQARRTQLDEDCCYTYGVQICEGLRLHAFALRVYAQAPKALAKD